MTDLARIALGLPVAALLPLGLPWLRGSRLWAPAATSAIYAVAVVLPVLCGWRAVLLVGLAAVFGAAGRRGMDYVTRDGNGESRSNGSVAKRAIATRVFLVVLLGASLALAAAAALVVDSGDLGDWLRDVAEDPAVSIVASGALAAIFVGGALVGLALQLFTGGGRGDDKTLRTIAYAGTYIGWCERALFFGFIVCGAPQAAALALAAKSFARFPALREDEEGFAEYFLIGTLTSLIVAMAAAIVTRVLIQLPPL